MFHKATPTNFRISHKPNQRESTETPNPQNKTKKKKKRNGPNIKYKMRLSKCVSKLNATHARGMQMAHSIVLASCNRGICWPTESGHEVNQPPPIGIDGPSQMGSLELRVQQLWSKVYGLQYSGSKAAVASHARQKMSKVRMP